MGTSWISGRGREARYRHTMPSVARLGRSADGSKVEFLSFHLLIPHNYAVGEDEIKDELTARIGKYDPEMKLKIVFLKSFV